MKYEHILNMEYSLRDAYFLFWLIKERGMPLPLLNYLCEYNLFDTHNYFREINEHPKKSELKKRLQKHLDSAKTICEMANNSDVGADNIALYGTFVKSSNIDRFKYVVIENFVGKGKPVYHCLTYLLELDLETSKPRWAVEEKLQYTEKEWKRMWEKFEYEFVDKYKKNFTFY